MKGVYFGSFHSFDDWGLLLQSKDIEAPTPKKKQIDLEGSDGVLDLTESFGSVKYSNRSLSFQFAKKEITQEEYLTLYSNVQNAVHGQKMHVVMDDDPNFFYIGRISVNEWKSDKNLGTIVIEVDAEPFKYDYYSSLDAWLWDSFDFENDIINELKDIVVPGKIEIIITGRKKDICPIITSNAAMQMIYEGKTYQIAAGSNKIYQLLIHEGDNVVKFIGSGTISIDYRGCSLQCIRSDQGTQSFTTST